MSKPVVEKYRKAAMKLYGISREDAEKAIYDPKDDRGEWAPKALAVICFEHGVLEQCSYYYPRGLDECFRLSDAAGVGFIEWINPAVAAVWE